MKCQIENCVRNSHGYCDGSLYVHIDQNGLCDNMELVRPTNAQKIRAMSDEELATFLDRVHNFPCEACCGNLYWCRRNNAPEPICQKHFLDWLRQLAEEDAHG